MMASYTLEKLLKHSRLALKGSGHIEVPFNLEEFCRDMDAELDSLRQRVAELERIVKQDADQLMMRDRIIRERGERMKTLWDAFRLYYPESKDMSPWRGWFDEAGETL